MSMCGKTLSHPRTSLPTRRNPPELPKKEVLQASKTGLQMPLGLHKTVRRHVTQPYLHHPSEILQKLTKVNVGVIRTKRWAKRMTAKIQIRYQHPNRLSLSSASAAAET